MMLGLIVIDTIGSFLYDFLTNFKSYIELKFLQLSVISTNVHCTTYL